MSGGSRDPVLRIAGGGRRQPPAQPPLDLPLVIGSLSNHHHDNTTRQRQRKRQKIVIFSKTTALHVHESFLYISLTITARLRRETFSCDVFWRTWTCDDQFSFLFLSLDIKSLTIQLHEKSPTFDILSRSK